MPTYVVTDTNGQTHEVTCDFLFNNSGELTMRSGERGRSSVDAIFYCGMWSSCVMKKRKTGETDDRTRNP